MGLEEINEYFTKMYKKNGPKSARDGGKKKKKDILHTRIYMFPTYITEQPYKCETLKQIIINKPSIIPPLCENGYITYNDIVMIRKENPEVFYYLPVEMYSKYPNLIDEICDTDSLIFDLLPKFLQKNEKIQTNFKRTRSIYNYNLLDKEGFDRDWLDEDGVIKSYFKLKNNFPIESKEDYMKILDVYLSSKMSVSAFCGLYCISDIDGFNEFLKRCGLENTNVNDKIKENKSIVSKKYIEIIKEIAHDFDTKRISFDDYAQNLFRPVHKISLLLNYVEDKESLIVQLVDYIEKNQECLNLSMILDLFDSNIRQIQNDIKAVIKLSGVANPTLMKKFCSINFDKYLTAYDRQKLKCKLIKDNVEYVIDDDVIDQAVSYAKDNNIYICYYTIKNISRKIVYGEINYLCETQNSKRELIESIIVNAIKKAKNISEYMNIMEGVNPNPLF